MKETSEKAYAMMINDSQSRTSVSGSAPGWCSGHNWASSLESYTDAAGLWTITWAETGNIFGDFPTIGTISSTDMLCALNKK